uniref:Uncharacterized protein n=1 Tax=Phaeomonas parva TaxID=124430 RepID=A0A7S1U6H6_9STRA|mmetsp:Transcript_30573/g.97563  ORF Transcript_30573/g.97563 Transcript_30573/m.97563 type:complete len:303 (+) Transcript_30573:164-1072(+)
MSSPEAASRAESFRSRFRRKRNASGGSGSDVDDVEASGERQLSPVDESGDVAEERDQDRIAAFEKDEDNFYTRITNASAPPLYPLRTKDGRGVASAAADRFHQMSLDKLHLRKQSSTSYMGNFDAETLLSVSVALKFLMIAAFICAALSEQYICHVDKICFADRDKQGLHQPWLALTLTLTPPHHADLHLEIADPATPVERGDAIFPIAMVVMLIIVPVGYSLADTGADGTRVYQFANNALMFITAVFFIVAAAWSSDDGSKTDYLEVATDNWDTYSDTVQWYYGDAQSLADQAQVRTTNPC